jgi:hypothetical protein
MSPVRRFAFPSVFLLAGLFFILLPFVGSTDENAKHKGALTLISLGFGLFLAGVSIWYMVSGYRSRSQPPQ